jgi:3D (Asp-Asp-Asp) domain-containing protein
VSILHNILNTAPVGKTRKMEVTAYCDCKKCNGRHAGKTASGIKPRQANQEKNGSIAADTRYYPFGTEIFVPGYGWGIVEDRGGAIKGPNRLDIFYNDHKSTHRWGRKYVEVEIYYNSSS